MRPTADIALRGIQENLLNVVAPRVTDPEAQRQIQSMAGTLARLADEWSVEPQRQREANEALVALVASAAEALTAAGGEWAAVASTALAGCAAAPGDDGTMLSIYRRQDALNSELVRVLEALETVTARAPSEAALVARAAIYRFLKTAQ